jgi:uncharacterized membrane protein
MMELDEAVKSLEADINDGTSAACTLVYKHELRLVLDELKELRFRMEGLEK